MKTIIASKELGVDELTGLIKRRLINSRITIDLENQSIIVVGEDVTYSPTGVEIIREPFSYGVDNIPAIEELVNAEGVTIREYVAPNPRFDNLQASPLGMTIAGMVQGTINEL